MMWIEFARGDLPSGCFDARISAGDGFDDTGLAKVQVESLPVTAFIG